MILRKFFNAILGNELDDGFYDELEETMIMADIGVAASEELIERLKEDAAAQKIRSAADCRAYLEKTLTEMMRPAEDAFLGEEEKTVYLLVGVNGVGKTTTAGKLAAQMKQAGRRVILCAADTFRAAAAEQLTEWSRRAQVELVAGTDGADPGAVVFDACSAARARGADALICDTAGRLHNKKNLMAELKKLYGIIGRECADMRIETLAVLDATTGQNALEQARQFSEAAQVTGIVLTKMDGTAKGGIAVAIQTELGIPVKYIGYGEKIEDLKRFDAEEYVKALFA